MNPKGKKSIVTGIPAWALSLMTAFISLIILFVLAGLLENVGRLGENTELPGYLGSSVFILISCYFICRKNPKSFWYVPVICNLPTIISACVEKVDLSPIWILVFSCWLISVFVAILGARIGKRHLN